LETVKEINILKYEAGKIIEKKDTVVTEYLLDINVNRRKVGSLSCMPGHLNELTIGYLYSNKLISNLSEVLKIDINIETQLIQVEVKCHSEKENMQFAKTVPTSVDNGLFISIDKILCNMDDLLQKSMIFVKTGAVHCCALIIDGELNNFREDIGRHNAFDKTIGAALYENVSLNNAIVLTSGRIPGDMMMKVIHSGIQIVVSRSAPTDLAIRLAKKYNVTLCGFARDNKLNIYSGKQRIFGY
jgi:FdhD protein